MTGCGDPNCNQDREAKMMRLDERTWCDPCIVPIVSALNAAGLRTIASCCGHGRIPAGIILADGREIIIARNYEEARRIDRLFGTINDPTTPLPGED